jgi:hypothetical protein
MAGGALRDGRLLSDGTDDRIRPSARTEVACRAPCSWERSTTSRRSTQGPALLTVRPDETSRWISSAPASRAAATNTETSVRLNRMAAPSTAAQRQEGALDRAARHRSGEREG